MRILLVMDPGILVPPKGYGGIERIVALLAAEYHKMGHEVDVLATKGSHVEGCNMHSIGNAGFPPAKKEMNRALFTAWKYLQRNRKEYDLIHNFGRLLYLLPVLNAPVRKIMCYQREITTRNIRFFNALPNKNIVYCGCSADLIKRANPPGTWLAVHNAVDYNNYIPTTNLPADAPLIFLGRIEKIKGCHTAIHVAKRTGHKLIIAGNVSGLPEEKKYFEEQILPEVDETQIIYIGEVNDVQKNEWLGRSKALLVPVEWDEPFGIVMIEAMACGTPVIAFNRGAIGEVVDENITGLKVTSEETMMDAVLAAGTIDRAQCRDFSKTRFHISFIAQRYLNLFK